MGFAAHAFSLHAPAKYRAFAVKPCNSQAPGFPVPCLLGGLQDAAITSASETDTGADAAAPDKPGWDLNARLQGGNSFATLLAWTGR
jgi:hypothetical protein